MLGKTYIVAAAERSKRYAHCSVHDLQIDNDDDDDGNGDDGGDRQSGKALSSSSWSRYLGDAMRILRDDRASIRQPG